MKKFLKGIGIYYFIVMTILFLIGYQGSALSKIEKLDSDHSLNKKVDRFETFIKSKNSINLILGSSLVQHFINPDSIGRNWFSFTNGGQNIYNSYKFLEYYQDFVKIDTIVIGIQPFDFPYSYIKNRQGIGYRGLVPFNNLDFYIFGYDSIITKTAITMRKIQEYKPHIFPGINKILSKNNIEEVEIKSDTTTKQGGFIGKIDRPQNNLDSLNKFQVKEDRPAYLFFYNVKDNPNIKYFDLFNGLARNLNIKVIYIITPKSKYYHLDLTKYNYDFPWNNILDSLELRNIEIWNYEKMTTNTLKVNWFSDDAHSNTIGRKEFTKIIKKRLRD